MAEAVMTKRSKRTGVPRIPTSVRFPATLRAAIQAEADAVGRSLGAEIEARLVASLKPADDLRTLIREEVRAALAESGPVTNAPLTSMPPAKIGNAISVLALDFGAAPCPASVSEWCQSALGGRQHPLLDVYIARQNDRQEAFYRAGGDLGEFRAEEWGEFLKARRPPDGAVGAPSNWTV